MKARIDSSGRLQLPKSLRDALGLLPGTEVDVTLAGDGLHLAAVGHTSKLERDERGRLVARADTEITDDRTLTPDLGHVESSSCWRKRDDQDHGQEELLR